MTKTLKDKIKSAVLPLGVAATVLMGAVGCSKNANQPQNDTLPPKAPAVTQKATIEQPTLNEATYQAFRALTTDNVSYYPRLANFPTGKAVVIGFGTPVDKDTLREMEWQIDRNYSANPERDKKINQHKKDGIYDLLLSGKDLSDKEMTYAKITNTAIQKETKRYLLSVEKEKLQPLLQQYGCDYTKLPADAKAMILAIDMATGGRVDSYKQFLGAVAKHDWKTAKTHCGINAQKYRDMYPGGDNNKGVFLNNNLKETAQRLIDTQNAINRNLTQRKQH